MYREHPIKILRHAAKNIWLLIFPVLRAVRSYNLDFDALYHWLTGLWIDVIFLAVMAAFGYFRWLFTFYRLGNHHIRHTTGMFIKTETVIAYDRISAVSTERPFWLYPLNAAKIRINTRAKTFGAGDMTLLVKHRHAIRLYRKLPMLRTKHHRTSISRPKWYVMFLYSFAFSSSLSGVIYLAALVFNAGRIISEPARENMDNVYRIANDVSENVSEKMHGNIPPVIIILLFIIAGAWLFSFVSNLLRYGGFYIKKNDNSLRIRTGIFTKHIFHINREKINYIDIRQNFLMKIFRVGSVNINCSGYGTSDLEHPVLLPILRQKRINELLKMLDMDKEICPRDTRPEKMAFWSYISIPFYLLVLMLAADFAAAKMFPHIADITMFIALMEVVPMVWFMTVKAAAFFTTGIAFRKDYCCVRYSRFLVYHTLLVDKNRLVKIQTFQDIIDEKWDRTRLDLYFTSEKTMANKIKGLNVNDAKKVIREFEQAVGK